jgi:uncharacterized membrane protein
MDLYSNFQLLIRWVHVLAGITWIGMLYFFNFVNLQVQAALDDAGKKAVNPKLMPRALWWFRWGAMITFLAGLILFTMIYMYTPGVGFGPSQYFTSNGEMAGRAIWILIGMLLGFWMWFNVWFMIWPRQKKMLGGTATPEELPGLRKKSGFYSKFNTYMSGPMLFCMLAPNHYGGFNIWSLVVILIVAKLTILVAYKISPKVGATV